MSNIIDEIHKRILQETKNFIEHAMDIVTILHDYMDKKKMSKKDLAKKMEISERKLKVLFECPHDYTLREISLIEAKLDVKIIPFLEIGFKKKKKQR